MVAYKQMIIEKKKSNCNETLKYSYDYTHFSLAKVGRVVRSDPGDLGSIPGNVIPKT